MADQELARVRSMFVEKVTMPVIRQLLDDLLEAHILNDGEVESILEENRNRADKARSIIDIVKRKGDGASRKMITYLQSRDPTLFSELGLPGGRPL